MRKNYLALSTEIPLHYHMNRIPQDGSDDEEDQPMEDETEPLNPAAEEQTNEEQTNEEQTNEEAQNTKKKNRRRRGRGYNYRKAEREANFLNVCCAWCNYWFFTGCAKLCSGCKQGCMEICGKCQLDDCGDCNCC